MFRYARRELLRNPRRTLASLVGVMLGVGLFSGVLFFVDGSGSSMTKRALAPLTLDMQRVLTSPLGKGLRLEQKVSVTGGLRAGEQTRVKLTVLNQGVAPVNEVLVRDTLSRDLEYVRGTATDGAKPISDVSGQSPFAHGPAKIGHNIGTVAPGARVQLSYLARARNPIPTASKLPLRATISSRENLVPESANPPALASLGELQRRIAKIPGVRAADSLASADLPAGSLSSGTGNIPRPTRIFGFDQTYAEHYPTIRLAAGSFDPHGALLSSEASRALGVRPGGSVQLSLPGRKQPIKLPVTGILDLSRATPLFSSRKGSNLEDFLYTPDSIVVSPQMFGKTVVPAARAAAAARGNSLKVKTVPILEVDVAVDRALLNSDPASALGQTRTIANSVMQIAPGQDYLLDNISNTVEVARSDAAVARRMFLFLGLPGLLMAAFLAAYAGSVLASTQRREQANLRLRGAHRGHLLRILAYRTAAVAGVGSLLGAAIGFASVAVILGPSVLFQATPSALLVSALVAVGAGVLTTGLALYLPGLRALSRDVSGERREMAVVRQPAWRRLRLDYGAAVLATGAAVVALRTGAFDAPLGSVSLGQSSSLPSYLLLLPLTAWFAGTLLSVRAFEGVARHLPVTAPPRFGPPVRGILARTLSRRSRALVTGIAGVGLVVAFGMGLQVFGSTYDAAKAADSKFTVGSNLRVTPSPLSRRSHPAKYATALKVPGISVTTPVVATLQNAFLRSISNSDVMDLAAIDPTSFSQTAALSDSFFPGSTAAKSMAALEADPNAVLLNREITDPLKLDPGATADLVLARGTKNQKLTKVKVAGFFDRFPGFPEGLGIVANRSFYQSKTGLNQADFFLARTTDQSSSGLGAAISAIQSGPGAKDKLNFDSTETTFNKDQSSLTALNIRGLVDLNSFYTLLISAAVIAIFVFGLMLQRRREYVILRAQGIPSRKLQALVLGEAAFVGLSGLAAGLLVGLGLGALLVHVLQPLFILPAHAVTPLGGAARLGGLVVAATVASTVGALTILRRLSPSEVLREQ